MSGKKNDERLYDLRTLDTYLARGAIKASEYDKHLKSLPDETGNYDVVVFEDEDENPSKETKDQE